MKKNNWRNYISMHEVDASECRELGDVPYWSFEFIISILSDYVLIVDKLTGA